MGVENLAVVQGLGVAVAKDDDAVAVVPGNETAITDLGLAEGVELAAGGRQGALIGETSLGKEGGLGGLLDAVGVEDAGGGVILLELGVDAEGEVGAVELRDGVFGPADEEETAFLVEGGGICAIVTGGEEAGHGGEDVVPGVGGLAELAESL